MDFDYTRCSPDYQEQQAIAWYYSATIMGMLENAILFLYDEQIDS